MHSVDELVELFRSRGLRITPQRRLIFALVADDPSHPTADDVYQRAHKIMPDLSRMTVYNTLAELVSLGELVEVQLALGKSTQYDTDVVMHHHLVCLRCRALVDIPTEKIDVRISPPESLGYRVTRHQVTLYGFCPSCQQTDNE
jgi:Fe2+ or Zn2+ uptake regulation protein